MSEDNHDEDKIELKIFGSDDPHLKKISELMANKTSKKIIEKLSQRPMYKNELVKELGLSMSLVDHHVKGLVESGVLKITRRKLIRKGKEHNFFKMIDAIVIFPSMTASQIIEKQIKKNVFKDSVKFMSMFCLGFLLFGFFTTQSEERNISLDHHIVSENVVSYFTTIITLVSFTLIVCMFLYILYLKKTRKDF